jgi:hypothetical protein
MASKLFANIRGAISGKAAQNNTDPAAVLDAGWKAMQQADPTLAAAIGKMPPQVAQGAVMQYTNAIRMGKEAEASTMAAEAARAGFASMPAAAPGAPAARTGGLRGIAGRLGAGQPQFEIGDVDSFNKAIAPAAQAPSAGGFKFGRLGQAAAQRSQALQQTQQQAAFKDVKDQYDAYEMSGYSDEDKKINASYGLGLDPEKKKNLSTYTGWSIKPPADGMDPQGGLINKAINPYNGSDGM